MRLFSKHFVLLKKRICINKKLFSTFIKPPWKVLFFGTDNFSVPSLDYLRKELKRGEFINTLEVVTSLKAKVNPVRDYALRQSLLIHGWPLNILLNKYDLGIVVSFGHLIPDDTIKKFHFGIINVHASLLPRWRGAAPIIYTIANEDIKTGVTIMKIQPKKFDIGEIIAKEEICIPENILMPDLHKQLAHLGASVLIKTLKDVPQCLHNATPQSENGITYAPKVSPNLAKINWEDMSAKKVFAIARALHGLYPLSTTLHNLPIKLYDIQLVVENSIRRDKKLPGTVEYSKKNNILLIKCSNETWISCGKIGILGKKPMSADDFNNGYLKKKPVEGQIFK